MDQSLLSKIVNTNLDFVVTEILPLIEKDYARVSASEVIDRLKQTVVVLTDNDPANKEQVNLIWGTLASDPEIIDAVRNAFLDAISKINDEKVKNGLTILINPITQTLVAVTDSTKPDCEQLKAIWKNFVESPEFLLFILSNLDWLLSKVIKDKNALSWITKIISAFIK